MGFINIQQKIKIEKERITRRIELDTLWYESTSYSPWYYHYFGEPDIFSLQNLFNEDN